MKRKPITAFLLSLVVPGLGHICSGNGDKGAVILVAAVIISSLNIMFLPVFGAANPDPKIVWAYWIPRIGHDVIAVWSIVFWLWSAFDAYREANKE
jgi:hypothetical protein